MTPQKRRYKYSKSILDCHWVFIGKEGDSSTKVRIVAIRKKIAHVESFSFLQRSRHRLYENIIFL